MKNIVVSNNKEMSDMINEWIAEGNKIITKFDQFVVDNKASLGAYYLAIIYLHDRMARENPELWSDCRNVVSHATKKQRETENN